MPVLGGFEEQYSASGYGPAIRRKQALTTPERRRQPMPYAMPYGGPFRVARVTTEG